MALFGLFGKKKEATQEAAEKQALDAGLERSRTGLFGRITRAIAGKTSIDDEVLDELEEILVSSDVGVDTTLRIIERIQARVKRDKYVGTGELNALLKEEIAALMKDPEPVDTAIKPYVIMVVGVNGVGKTTTIGKLAHAFKKEGKQVVLGAADTFRAAAVDQLRIWSERVGVTLVQQGMNADPAAVAYDTVESAKARGADIVIIDTAGRLHNKVGLMNELTKVRNVMRKVIPDAPHEVLLVLDASTGQNAIEQARQFTKATDVTALALTKIDGTAKGGVAIGISEQFNIPIKYLGVGEGIDHLQVFDKKAFVEALFKQG
jgi:fused signal recognition particle receptor